MDFRLLSVFVLFSCVSFVLSRWIIRDGQGTPVLEVLFERNATQVYRDERTLIWDFLSIWEPIPTAGFYLLGHKAQGDWEPMRGNVIMVKDIVGDLQGRYMRAPEDFIEIWRDEGGFGIQDVAFWRPVCPAGFYSLGDIAFACEWCGWPKPLAYLSRIRCVSAEVAEPCSVRDVPLWTNDGGFENQRGSVWNINPEQGMTTFWKANQGWEEPPENGVAYCLKQAESVEDEF